MSDLKFVSLFDIHFGTELVETSNGWKSVIAHDTKLLKRVLNFIKDFQPDTIILGGDQLNFDDISKYTKHFKLDKLPGSIKNTFNLCTDLLIDPLIAGTNADIIWIDGNHEARLNQIIAEVPAVSGLLTYPWSYYDQVTCLPRGAIYKLGKLHFIHGDTIKGGGRHPAVAIMNKYHCNIRAGHFHTYDVAVENSLADSTQTKTAIVTPCMRNRQPGFLNNAPNKHLQGFGYGFVTKEGNFNDYVVIDFGGFTIDGKHYS